MKNTIVPGALRGVNSYAVIKDPTSNLFRRINEDSVALVIADGPPVCLPGIDFGEDSSLCLVHARSGNAPDLGWIVHSDLVPLDEA